MAKPTIIIRIGARGRTVDIPSQGKTIDLDEAKRAPELRKRMTKAQITQHQHESIVNTMCRLLGYPPFYAEV